MAISIMSSAVPSLGDHYTLSKALFSSAIWLCSLVLILFFAYRGLLPKPLPGIPYNPEAIRSPLGDIPNMANEVSKTSDMMTWLLRQNRRHNAPLSQVFISPFSFGKPTLLLSDMREMQDILIHRIKELDRTSFTNDVFGGPFPNFHLPLPTGPEWKAHRRLLQDLMTPSFLEKVVAPAIYKAMREAADLWALKAHIAQGRPFEAAADIHKAALDAVMAFSFGKDFPHRATLQQTRLLDSLTAKDVLGGGDESSPVSFPEAKLPHTLQSMVDVTESMIHIKSALFPRLKWEIISRLPRLARAVRGKDELVRGEITKAVQTLKKHEAGRDDDSWVRSAVDHIVDRETRFAQKEGRRLNYLSPVMQGEVFGFVVAGHDTTSTSLAWGVKLLADNPVAQRRLRFALRAAFPSSSPSSPPTCIEVMRASITYLDATIEEILRRGGPTVPVIGREATQDTVLLGHHVPKGTIVFMLSSGAGAFEPAHPVDEAVRSASARAEKGRGNAREWDSADMASFKPERWLTPVDSERCREVGDGEEADLWWQQATFDAKAGPSLPFGGGVRGCFGRRLAYIEMRMFLVAILWRFQLLRCPEKLSGYAAYDGVVHKPVSCFVRLEDTGRETI